MNSAERSAQTMFTHVGSNGPRGVENVFIMKGAVTKWNKQTAASDVLSNSVRITVLLRIIAA